MSAPTTTRPAPSSIGAPVLQRLWHWADTTPEAVALRRKKYGLWQTFTWHDYREQVLEVGHALLSLGVDTGDRVAIHSENRPEWVFADFGTVAVRAVTHGLYPTNPPAEVEYLLRDSEARILVAEDQEQVDKVLAVSSPLPHLEWIIYLEHRGVSDYDDPRLLSWDDLLARGRQHRQDHPGAVEQRLAAAELDDVALLIYTSGTTGPPKGAALSLRNISFAMESASTSEGFIVPPANPDDVYLSYLPLCHVYERLLGSWVAVNTGMTVFFAESIDTLQADLWEVQPTIFASVPRILEKIVAGVEIRMASASRLKRLTFRAAMRLARHLGRRLVANGGQYTARDRVVYAVGWLLLFRPLKDRIGLLRCRHAISGAAPIAPDILEWFMGIGVPIVEGYGQTESSAIATINRPGRIRLGTTGEPLPGVAIRLDESGEILLRHDGVFVGYWGNEEATRQTIDEDGWLHTGDVGEWVDDTYLRIVDRVKDIIITSGGKNISPSEIENHLKVSPYVREAVVIGEGRKYLTALIGIELDTVGEWAQQRGLPYTTYRDLTDKPEVLDLIQGVVDSTNERFARVEQIKSFRLIPKELDHEEGELTATQKVKRSAIADQFAPLIEQMYGASPQRVGASSDEEPAG